MYMVRRSSIIDLILIVKLFCLLTCTILWMKKQVIHVKKHNNLTTYEDLLTIQNY